MSKKVHFPRYLHKDVKSDLRRKMVFLGGPRQSGKTTLAKKLLDDFKADPKESYLNWDAGVHRELILKEQFPAKTGMLVLDEVHKFHRWRQVVKGLFDTRGNRLKILVTGSARLDHYRHGGDSLQGRYHFYRLHPLTFSEVKGFRSPFPGPVKGKPAGGAGNTTPGFSGTICGTWKTSVTLPSWRGWYCIYRSGWDRPFR